MWWVGNTYPRSRLSQQARCHLVTLETRRPRIVKNHRRRRRRLIYHQGCFSFPYPSSLTGAYSTHSRDPSRPLSPRAPPCSVVGSIYTNRYFVEQATRRTDRRRSVTNQVTRRRAAGVVEVARGTSAWCFAVGP